MPLPSPLYVILDREVARGRALPELLGAVLILSNRMAHIGGWLIFIFLVPVTIVVHGVSMVTTPDPVMEQIQLSFFLKGVAMAGAALLITQIGVVKARREA